MTTGEMDLVGSETQPTAAMPVEPPTQAAPVDLLWTEESTPTVQNATSAASLGVIELAPASDIAASLPGRRRWFRRSRTRSETKPPRHFGARWFAVTFVVGTVVSLAILAAVAVGLSNTYANRVFPGVRVGSIDVSGLSRDQVIAKLKTDYAYLGQGKVTVTTPIGTDTITFAEAGRGPDLEVMADAAMSAGHTGSAIGDAAVIIRSAIRGETLPVVVQVDPTALAARIHRLVGTNAAVPKNAKVTVDAGTFAVSPSTAGSGIDEQAISGEIIDKLTRADAPTDLKSGGTFVTLGPQVTDKDAQDAIAAAQKMAVNVTLVWSPTSQSASPGESPSASAGASATPSPSPTPSQSPAPTKTFAIDAQTIRSWIVFGFRTDGSYGPSLDLAPMQAYLSQLAPQMAVKAEEPWITFDATGAPAGLKNGKDGSVLDVDATSKALEAYFSGLAAGNSPASNIAVATMAVPPSINLDSLNGFGLMGQGTWTTTFYPDISNDFGANIRTPANLLNGQVVGPGQQFSFLNAVGPIDAAHGYGMGGVIQGGHSNHTGAMGGGICSASTTMFNAAMRAGLQIDERHAHFYYITRYPVGLDATVYSNGYEVWDLKWTNDTPYPIVIRASTTRGSKSTITIQLWSLPIDRTVTLSPEFKANIIQPIDTTEYVSSLPAGQTNRAEVPTAGFDTSRTRTVTDSTGKVIHSDTWNSHYTKVDGVLQIGGTPPEPPKPTPAPGTPTPPPAAPTPTPVATPAPRRRRTV